MSDVTESQTIPGKKDIKTAQDAIREEFKTPEAPDDFETVDDFLRWATKTFDDDLYYDQDNRDQGIEDTKFMVGEQWERRIKQMRQAAYKPTMVFNRLPAFVAQIVGNRRLNETEIVIIPDDKAFKKTAQIREGLIRSVQKTSRANIAYNKALENQVISGMGNFEIVLEYAHDDVFEQDIKIKPINNAFSVVWDRATEDPTGQDARWCWKVSTMDRDDFVKEWPDAAIADLTTDTHALGLNIDQAWITRDDVRVVDLWRVRTKKRIFALLRDDTDPENPKEDVEDVTDTPFEDFKDRLVKNAFGAPVMREADRKYVELYTLTALDLLEGPYILPISRVPIFAVPGWDINVGEYRTRFGLIRFLKDPQRLHNYWRSVIAEKLMLTPKGNWIATDEAVEGRESEWRNSHLNNDQLLIYNADAGVAPIRVPASQLEPALIQEANMAAQDLRDISNLHEASLGQKSNEVSGKAILARQRAGETGTVIYQDNLELAIEEAGRVCNQLIPHVYDTVRTIKVMGKEGQEIDQVIINDETDADSVDITAGKYTVTSVSGPSYVTKRVEAQDSMLNMVNAMPDTMALVAADIIENQDWPGADKMAARLRARQDPSSIPADDRTPEQQQAVDQQTEQQQLEAQKADALFQAELREKIAKALQAEGNAAQANANAARTLALIDIDELTALEDMDETKFRRVMDAVKMFNEITQGDNDDQNTNHLISQQ